MALTTLAQIKAFQGITGTASDAQLSALLLAADPILKAYLGRDIESTSYTQFYSGTNTKHLVLRQRPVTAVTNVWVDNNGNFGSGTGFDSTTLLTAGTDYALQYDQDSTTSRSGILVRINTTWPEVFLNYTFGRLVRETGPALGNIKVQYTAGYTTIPMDLQYAVSMIVAYMKRTAASAANLSAERIGEYSYEIMPGRWLHGIAELSTAFQILSRYKETPI